MATTTKTSRSRKLVSGHKHGRVPRAVRQEQLLDVAEALFTRQGFEYTSIEDVARQAGVTRPIIYAHYGSKEGLYLACVKRARADYEAAMLETFASTTDPRRQLERGADLYFSMIERDPKRWLLLFGGAAVPLGGELGQQLTALRIQTVRHVAAQLRAHRSHMKDEHLEAAAHAISGIGEQLGLWWMRRPDVPKAQVISYYCDFIWNGIANP